MITAFSFHSNQHYKRASTTTDVMMNISSNGIENSNFTEESHHYHPLYQNHHEFVSKDIKEGLVLNETSSPEQSPNTLTSHVYHHYLPPYRQVKRRRRLTEEETNVLNNVFENVQKPDAATRAQLAQQLNISSRAIQVWFQNRRAKVKRDALESKNASKNKPKKLTLAVDYFPEKMKPPKNISNPIGNSRTNLPRKSRITPILANLSTSPEEPKLEIPVNVNYWNYRSTYDSYASGSSLTDGQTTPLALPYFPNNFFHDNNCADSFRYNLSSPVQVDDGATQKTDSNLNIFGSHANQYVISSSTTAKSAINDLSISQSVRYLPLSVTSNYTSTVWPIPKAAEDVISITKII
ncbi:1912_t:CDS:2 [Funneliformis mosseae]|uniref:1912_t:CDS:1 n=1 Tax=Funneliformis mosseae TaxID=27381 RepID=A0A9N8V3G4_FUNMO|nr:1912_t:CDS:2 [Funneliformis mosseae]